MFGWFKRRLLFEHKKLLLLNYRCAFDRELRTRLLFNGNYDVAEALDETALAAGEMLSNGVPASGLDSQTADNAFRLNKELMSVCEAAGNKVQEFEQSYRPIGGWKEYFERTGDGWNQVEKY